MILIQSYQNFQEELIPILLDVFHTMETEKSLPNSFYEATVTLIRKPHKDSTKKENYSPFHSWTSMQIFSIKYWQAECKYTTKNYPLYSSRLHPRDAGLFQHMKIYVNHHMNKLRKKSYDHFIRCWKALDKIQNPFMIKVLERLEIQGSCLNIIKALHSKPTDNIKLKGEKLKAVPLKSRTKQGCPLSSYFFNIVLEV